MKPFLIHSGIKLLSAFSGIALSSLQLPAQPTYQRALIHDNYQSVSDMRLANGQELHIAATEKIYRLNSSGDIVFQKEIKELSYSEIRAAIPLAGGGNACLLHALEGTGLQQLVFFQLSSNGNVTGRKVVQQGGSYDIVKMVKLTTDRYLISYKYWEDGNTAFVGGICIDANGTKIWEKSLTDEIYNYYAIDERGNGVDLLYRKKNVKGGTIVRIDADGTLTPLNLNFSNQISEYDHLNQFDRLPDGGYLLAGSRYNYGDKLEDILIAKVDATGNEGFVKTIDIRQRDHAVHVQVVNDGILLLAGSGNTSWSDSRNGEIILLKTDFNGNETWRRAFDSPSSDLGYFILQHDNSIFLSGRMSIDGGTIGSPVVFRFDGQGKLLEGFPFDIEPNDALKEFTTGINDDIQVLAGAIAGNNNNIILGINRIDKENDRTRPYVVAVKTNNQVSWTLNLPEDAGELKVINKVRTNDNLVITERRDVFNNVYDITQFDDHGNMGWTFQTGANHMRKTIGTADGGYLLLGDVDVSFVNYEVQLVKLDANGRQQWRKTFGQTGKWELPQCITETPDGDFIIVGTSMVEFDVISRLFAMRISPTGQLRWQNDLGVGPVEENVFRLERLPNGDYRVAGFYSSYPFENRDMMVTEFTAQGTLVEKYIIDLHKHDEIKDILTLERGKTVVVGNTDRPSWGPWQQRAFIMDLTSNYALRDYKIYGDGLGHVSFAQFIVTSNGDTLIVGTRQPYYGFARPVFMPAHINPNPEPDPGPEPTDIIIAPNPSSSGASLRWTSDYVGEVMIQVYDAKGQLCFNTTANKENEVYRYQLPTLYNAPGLYFVHVQFGPTKKTLKWLRLH